MDYAAATYEQILNHVMSKTSLTIYKARRYHVEHGNLDVVKKIDTARLEAKVIRCENTLLDLKRELYEAKCILE